jgi:hypothetical protein
MPEKRAQMHVWKGLAVMLMAVLGGTGLLAFLFWPAQTTGKVVVGDAVIRVKIARTVEEKQRGLAGVRSLARDQGMLFVFDRAEVLDFWMKGMAMPIDIVFFRSGRIVDIASHMSPPPAGQEPPIRHSAAPADMALEVPAGTAAALRWATGTRMTTDILP